MRVPRIIQIYWYLFLIALLTPYHVLTTAWERE